MIGPIVPNLWFTTEAQEAAEFYTALFPHSRVIKVVTAPPGSPIPEGQALTVEWELDGQRFVGINGGPHEPYTDAVSFCVTCADSDELDHFWDGLLADGGRPTMCGWLIDRFGVRWQVVPEGLGDVLGDPDPERARRATEAMLQMRKLDLAAIRAAAAG